MKKIILAFIVSVEVFANEEAYLNNINVYSSNISIESLKYDHKINKGQYYPELSLSTGIGSEKLIDKTETDKGPTLFLNGKINLYRGGRDQYNQKITSTNLKIALLEKDVTIRNIKIETFKIVSAIEYIEIDNQLIEDELKNNIYEQKMAKKKVDAGLTSNVDLLDFDIKNESLNNELQKNKVKMSELNSELLRLYQNKFDITQIKSLMSSEVSNLNADYDTKSTPEFLQKIELSKNAKLEIKNAKSEYLPEVNLEAKWGQITPNNNWRNSSNREHQFSLNVNFPLFNGFSSDYRTQKALLISTQKEKEAIQFEIDLQSKFNLDLKKIELSKNILKSIERSFDYASKFKELTLSEYRRGIKNSSDVINASDRKLEIKRKTNELKMEISNDIFAFNQKFKPFNGE